jgi:hypothetical protein
VGGGSYGRTGGGNQFYQHGRVFDAHPILQCGGCQGFRQPQLGAIPMEQPHAIGTGAPENLRAQAPNQSNGSQGAMASGTTGGPNMAAQGGAASASLVHQAEQASQPSLIDIGGLSVPATELFKQLLTSMTDKGKAKEEVQPLDNMKAIEKVSQVMQDKAMDMAESSAQGEARRFQANPKPYCHRYLSKGHIREDCVTLLVCDICSSLTHLKPRCLLQKKANKVFCMTCWSAVDGLGFYYIPQQSLPKHKSEHNAAIIQVVEGAMSADQVTAELDRLVPSSGKWEVQVVD